MTLSSKNPWPRVENIQEEQRTPLSFTPGTGVSESGELYTALSQGNPRAGQHVSKDTKVTCLYQESNRGPSDLHLCHYSHNIVHNISFTSSCYL